MYRQQKKIPTILALFILFLGIGGVALLNQTSHQVGSQAQTSASPQDIHFANISDTSFTVSWFSAASVLGEVIVKDNNHTITYLEDIDSDNIPRARTTHFATVKNLKENTSYEVKVVSGDSTCKISQNCPSFIQKTANHINSATPLPPARGQIVTEDQKPADNALVYLTVGKNPPLATKTDSLGLWVISFNNLRAGDFLSRPNLSDNDIVQIIAKISPDKQTEAVTDVKSIRQNLTIPPLAIGKSYNLIDLISKKDLLASINKKNTLGVQTQIGGPGSIDILFPAKDNDTTSDTQPRFRGIGVPGNQVIITVNSTSPQIAKITVGADGTWSWRPPSFLEPGLHHIGISTYDKAGNYISLTKSFIVLKSGEQVLGEATASATLTPTVSLSPTLVPLASPTITLIPLATPTLNPSIGTPSATPIVPPKTGYAQSTLLLLGSGASLLLLGLKFILFP